MPEAKYKRVMLKLSGEALRGAGNYVIDNPLLVKIAQQIKTVIELGIGVGIVVGGGNIWRGAQAEADGMDRVTADYAGMLATVINALALQDILEKQGIQTRTMSALDINKVAEPYIRRRALRHFEKGRVVKATAEKNQDFLVKTIATDDGSKRIGEFAIGTNEGIKKFTREILFDEKIGGSFHMALGSGYPETGSKNESSIHWDMVCDLRDGGEIRVDDTLFYKNGKFVIKF